MNDDGRWVTINGAHVFIKNGQSPMDAFIRQKGKDRQKEYFDSNFHFEDDDYYKEFNQNKKDFDYKKEKDWNEEKKAYDNKSAGIFYKRISVIDKKTNEEAGHIKYKEVYDPNKTDYNDKINIDEIVVKENYRRKGIATQLYKEVQRRAGNNDIFFGELTPEGKKLIEKIGIVTKKRNGKYPDYWGRIKL